MIYKRYAPSALHATYTRLRGIFFFVTISDLISISVVALYHVAYTRNCLIPSNAKVTLFPVCLSRPQYTLFFIKTSKLIKWLWRRLGGDCVSHVSSTSYVLSASVLFPVSLRAIPRQETLYHAKKPKASQVCRCELDRLCAFFSLLGTRSIRYDVAPILKSRQFFLARHARGSSSSSLPLSPQAVCDYAGKPSTLSYSTGLLYPSVEKYTRLTPKLNPSTRISARTALIISAPKRCKLVL
ncbi:hypothetical protein DFH06DRAFT_1133486 [Mycena polygramma]|nr:hypothetical protein DFH06DRAFT_1133486 [Mycena polygramma]